MIPGTMPSERVQRRIDRLLDQAEEAADRREWVEAVQLTTEVLALDPENEDAPTLLSAAQKMHQDSSSRPQVSDAIVEEPPASMSAPVQSADDVPDSFVNGRYKVIRLLGEGGKKMVYLALDTTLDREVAFGLIKAEGLDQAARQRVTREAQAMARLGDHPNIMPIFDFGEENRRPYMVQPNMGGGDVEGLLERAPDGRLPLSQAIEIATQVLSGLEFAHSKGVIHRDLKPGNVWLAGPVSEGEGDGEINLRIGDFGLALSIDRSRLTREAMIIGTVSYMPPEQATGGEITGKADLYSLGAMLYEMVTGRPPFLGDDEIAIISQHVNTPPVAPAWHNQEIPAQLDSLIMRLLAKDPAERPESAADALAALAAVDLSDSAAGSGSESGANGAKSTGSLDAMAGGVFVGRQGEMDRLKSMLERALSGRGGMVALAGEPGVGKTRTALELETYAGLRNAQVLWGRSYEDSGAPPYWPWVQALRSYVAMREPEELRREMGSTAAVISEIVPDIGERLSGLQPAPFIDDPNSARFRLFDAITNFLKRAAEAKPLILILDDLHWADQPSLMLLEFVARELASSKILIVGTYRDMELNRRHPLSVMLGDLGRDRLFERVVLRGISREDVHRFIEIATGIQPPAALVEAIFTQTEGNPLFVTETVRLFVQEGELTKERLVSNESWTVRTPEGVREAIGRRLDRLSQKTNDVLIHAAVVGREFTFEQLSAVLDNSSDDPLLDAMDESIAARVVEEMPAEIGRYRFSHALIQRALSDELSTTRRVRLHARIALALEAQWGDKAEEHAGELAFHFGEAQSPDLSGKLAHYALLAGEESLRRADYEAARVYFDDAHAVVADGPDDEIKARILFGVGRAGVVLPGAEERQAALDRMIDSYDIFERIGETAMAIRVAQQPVDIVSLIGVVDLAARGLKLAEPGSADEGWLLSRYGTAIHAERGEFEPARVALERALKIAISIKDVNLESRVTTNLTQRFSAHDLIAESIEYGERAKDLVSAIGDRISEMRLGTFLSNSYIAAGRVDDARDILERVGIAAASLNVASYLSYSWGDKAKIAMLCGDWGGFSEILEQAAEELDARWGGVLYSLEATFHYERGDLEAGDQVRARNVDESGRWSGIADATATYSRERASGEMDMTSVKAAVFNGSEKYRQRARATDTLLAMVAVAESDVGAAEAVYAELNGREGGMDYATGIAHGHVLGLLAKLLGDAEAAASHFDDGIAFCRGAGYRPELAWICAEYAQLLLATDTDGDKTDVAALQDEALSIAQDIGMQPVIAKVLAQREMLTA